MNNDEYCRNLVRELDRDRYLASLLAPSPYQRGLLALYAFNGDVARIAEQVSEPGLGEIRLKWWQDVISAIYQGVVPEHPVAAELGWLITNHDLPRQAFENLLLARQFDLYEDPMPALNDLEGYLGETSSILLMLAARIMAGKESDRVAEVAGLGGIAYGLSGLLRALPLSRARGQCFMPVDKLSEFQLKPAHILAGRNEADMAAFLTAMIDHADKRLNEARTLYDTIPVAALPAFLPLVLVDKDLQAIRRAGVKVLDEGVKRSPLAGPWRMWRQVGKVRF